MIALGMCGDSDSGAAADAAHRAVPLCHFFRCPGPDHWAVFHTGGAQAAGAVFQVDVNTRLAAANSHDTYGLTLSLWRDCFLQAKKSPEGYSEAYMEQVLARIDEILTEDSADAPPQRRCSPTSSWPSRSPSTI